MAAKSEGQSVAYIVMFHQGRHEVRTASGRTVMVCRDEGSAAHYAELLNEAYRAGQKAGYRAGRRGASIL